VGTFFLSIFIYYYHLSFIYISSLFSFFPSYHSFFTPFFISTSKREEHSPNKKQKNPGNSGKFPLYDAASCGEGRRLFWNNLFFNS